MMLRVLAAASLTVLASVGALGQNASRPTFEVSSVKPSGSTPQGPRINAILGGPGTNDPGRIRGSGVTLQRLLREAYGVDFDQIQGPAWMADERYEVTANVPPGATKEQLKLMLQGLLEERFKLALHIVKKDFAVYELTPAKSGLKLKENTDKLEPSSPGDRECRLTETAFHSSRPANRGWRLRYRTGSLI